MAALLELGSPPPKAEYSDLFSFQLYPYASVYLGAEGMLGGEARDRIAGFWRVLDLEPPPEPDHLSTMLAFYGELSAAAEAEDRERERTAAEQARVAFLHEHLLSWLPVCLAKLERIAGEFYRDWGRLLAASLEEEAAGASIPDRLPLHLREAPPLPAPHDAGGKEFLAALLTPVRAGFLLVRSDLTRAGRELGLGVRAGERKYTLEALLGQDAAATLDWLQSEALAEARAHETAPSMPPAVRAFWRARADTAAETLVAAREAL